jgi:hypothetical protein
MFPRLTGGCLSLVAGGEPPAEAKHLWLKSVLAVNAPHLYRATRPWRRVRTAACEDVAAGVPANPLAVLPGGLYHVVAGRLSSIDVENLSRHKPGTIQI